MKFSKIFLTIIASALVVSVSSCTKEGAGKQYYDVCGDKIEIGRAEFQQNYLPGISALTAYPSTPITFKGEKYTLNASYSILFNAEDVNDEVALDDIMITAISATNYINFTGSLGVIVDGKLLEKYPNGSYLNISGKTPCVNKGKACVKIDAKNNIAEVIVKESSMSISDDKGNFLGKETLDTHFKVTFTEKK